MLLMKIRHIYRWDDPTETGQYLAAYVFLWAINYISGAAVGCQWLNSVTKNAEFRIRSSHSSGWL